MDRSVKIGIIGSGVVGQALGRGFATLGHEVKIGSREPQKLDSWVKAAGPKTSAGSLPETALFGDVLVLATLWGGTESAIRIAGAEKFAGKVVLDATNPLAHVDGAPPGLALGHTDSGGEQVQRWLDTAKVVKAFNTVGNAQMFRPTYPDGRPDMFIAGNDAGAKKTVAEICADFGWGVVDAGDISAARLLEPMAILWVRHGVTSGQWTHAFKLLRK